MPKKRGHGEGASYYIPSRRLYRRVLDLGSDETGKRIQLPVSSRTAAGCLEKYEALVDKVRKNGGLPPAKARSFADYATEWLDGTARTTVDPKTYATYRSLTNRHLIPHLRRRRIDQVTPADVRGLRAQIVDKAKLSTSTAKQAHTVLSMIMDAAKVDRLITGNPCEGIRRPKAAASDREALTHEQAIAVLRTAALMPDAAGARWWLKLLGGPRQTEILGATLECLDLGPTDADPGLLEVAWKLEEVGRGHGCDSTCGYKRGANCTDPRWLVPDGFEMRHLVGRWCLTRPKSKTGKVIPLIPILATAIRRHLAAHSDEPNPHGLIWRHADGSPIEPAEDAAEWRDLLQAAGVITAEENHPGGTKLTGHCARHTTVTVLAELGVDFQVIGEIVGHSAAQVTAMYRHAQIKEKRAAMELLGGVWAEALAIEAAPTP